MQKFIRSLLLGLALVMFMSLNVQAVNVDIYSSYGTISGGGAPYSGLVSSFTSADVMFATNYGYSWHPSGLYSFGADITGCLQVASSDTYSFTLNSDDGSMLYIDGSLVVNNGGPHAPITVTGSTSLTAGKHSFEVQFYEDFGNPSGVDLYLPAGVEYTTCTPLPSPLLLFAPGLLGLLGLRKHQSV
jgi:hypothetical protein